jgi:hypothetical protein
VWKVRQLRQDDHSVDPGGDRRDAPDGPPVTVVRDRRC